LCFVLVHLFSKSFTDVRLKVFFPLHSYIHRWWLTMGFFSPKFCNVAKLVIIHKKI
jgi:hypothetical protein